MLQSPAVLVALGGGGWGRVAGCVLLALFLASPPVAAVAGACCQQGRQHYYEGSLHLFQPVLHLHRDSPAETRTGYIPGDFLHFPQPEEEEAEEEEEFPGGGWLMEPRSNQPFGGTEP